MNTAKPIKKHELYARLDGLPFREANSFRRRLKRASAPNALHAISDDVELALMRVTERREALPQISYPNQLPVSARRNDIAEAIENNQVVVIAGETGSGKTTQIPKICLELGRGVLGKIGHTQPRRIAARSVAERIADELGEKVGQHVGYAIRFDDKVSDDTCIKLMTDGIMLAEIQRDRYLREYDTIIIDEAHERSLNIDFLLGYLKHILPKRPDLKVIITSATIDPKRFSTHFSTLDGTPAPIIEVSGRTYPVEIRYRPLEDEYVDKRTGEVRVTDIEPIDGVLTACTELMREGDGDILIFFSGEREIRDAAEAIEAKKWRNVEVVPLFGRLSNAEQHRVFAPHASRRIVLATNIAETSLTVPGIEYVIDTGNARISRYSTRTKVQRLPIEKVSQASANQRSGRCGRVADGIAIRLYSEDDFLSRPEFTDPEILRTNLASVILHMAALRLGDIEDFPFVEPPETKAIRDGVNLLVELQAIPDKNHQQANRPIDPDKKAPTANSSDNRDNQHNELQLTRIGCQLARIPVDPRLARMLIEAKENGALHEVIVIVAALSLQDVRERPLEFQAQADQAHARFRDKTSDFFSYLKLWEYVAQKKQELSGNQFRKMCKREFLHYLRVREWQDLVRQLQQVVRELGWDPARTRNSPTPDAISQSLLPGLLSHIGFRDGDGKEFTGTRNTKFLLHPSSALAKKPPQWVMAAEIVETSRTFARDAGAISPQWIEKTAAHLFKFQYSEPHWSLKHGNAMVYQKATLYGVPVVVDRLISFARINPEEARTMFIRSALMEGQWQTHHAFYKNNLAKLDDVAKLEDKARTRGIVVDDEVLYTFYDAKLPQSVTGAANFNKWWKSASRNDPTLLDFDSKKLVTPDAKDIDSVRFPEIWHQGKLDFAMSYKFEPGADDDGVTLHIPIPLLTGVRNESFDWLVPGLRAELAEATIRTLPKALRRTVVPAPEYAAKALEIMTPYARPFKESLADALRTFGGHGIDSSDFEDSRLPNYLKFNFAAVNRHGKVVDQDRNLGSLQARHAGAVNSAVSQASIDAEHSSVENWTEDNIGTVPETVTNTVDGQRVIAFPTLVATNDGVAMKVMPTKNQADASLFTAVLTMLLRSCTVSHQQMLKGLPLQQRVAVDAWPHGGAAGLVEDCRVSVVRDAMVAHGGPVKSPADYAQLENAVSAVVAANTRQLVVGMAKSLPCYLNVANSLQKWEGEAIDDMTEQLNFMLPKGAVARHGWRHLRHLPRYLAAMEKRLSEMNQDPDKDADREYEVTEVKDYLQNKLKQLPKSRANSTEVREVGWLIQELRVSLFAQNLGTARSVSPQRIKKAIDKLR